ncbi:hypothetical protein OTU49_003384, partial [Cherax quadricarinatus]
EPWSPSRPSPLIYSDREPLSPTPSRSSSSAQKERDVLSPTPVRTPLSPKDRDQSSPTPARLFLHRDTRSPCNVKPSQVLMRERGASGTPLSMFGFPGPDFEYMPSTQELIERQSQDFIDERLAEFQAQIHQLQDEQERVQKKTFMNWINAHLARHVPPLKLNELIEDLKDGTALLALLEVLSGEKLPIEKGRVLRRPHFLSNANTALQFLQSKRIKLVNINSTDLVDG